MRCRCVVGCCVMLLAVTAPATAQARLKPITGKLSVPGYTVIALASDGRASTAVTRAGRFSLRPPVARVTLHLRAANGTYAGPIVIARAGKRAVVGVRSGSRLGRIVIRRARGYARVAKRPARRHVDRARWARADGAVPIGARNFGRVRSALPPSPPPGDRDADGVADPLDIDGDGDLVLDDVDRSTAGRARAAQTPQQNSLGAFTSLYEMGNANFPPGGPFTQPININAPGVTEAQVDAALAAEGQIYTGASMPGPGFAAAELDCGGLPYCSAGGTGKKQAAGSGGPSGITTAEPFPACCDADGDGLGEFDVLDGGINVPLEPHATSDRFRAGDVLIAHATMADGTPRDLTGTLASVFATVPTISKYVDELGVEHELTYPLTPWGPEFPKQESLGDEVELVDGSDDGTDVSVDLTFWRPQRRAVPEELAAGQGSWIDMGGLIHFAHTLGGAGDTWCPASSYSNVSSSLVATPSDFPADPPPVGATVFVDQALDQAASIGNTFGYTLNVTQCLAAHDRSFGPGERVAMIFDAFLPPNPPQPVNYAEAGYSFFHEP